MSKSKVTPGVGYKPDLSWARIMSNAKDSDARPFKPTKNKFSLSWKEKDLETGYRECSSTWNARKKNRS